MNRNEAETCADLINPKLTASGWGIVPGTRIRREHPITQGRLQSNGRRLRPLKADYVLEYKGQKLAIIEAKKESLPVSEGVAQAKEYAHKMQIGMTYASNGHHIYEIDIEQGTEGSVDAFPTPEALWQRHFATENSWHDRFSAIPFEDIGGSKQARYYQESAVHAVMAAIADRRQRILLTLATGTGKTFIAFQIAWKLFYARWNLRDQHRHTDGTRRPRILFLADRNILADQAFNAFNAFPDDALIRIRPDAISKKRRVPTNGSLFFTIFQTFMSGKDAQGNPTPYFGDYPNDFFDFIIIDECHRGGASDESSWHSILTHFAPAVQLGLTATPKRKDNVDTYAYFGEPVYVYSLKEGINDGFLTPFRVKRIETTIDDYTYTSDDVVIEGNVEAGREYTENEFNRIIEIKERERARVCLFMQQAHPDEKSLVFCATQEHAALIRDLINQESPSTAHNYCVRVTADDGALGEQYLREFQDNEKSVPTILTTSQKLSTGVDARNVRNIVLLRPVNSMIEFKQIVGRGTRLFEGKAFFTLYDFVRAYHHFHDPEWDGEAEYNISDDPQMIREKEAGYETEGEGEEADLTHSKKVRIKLSDGKVREIEHMTQTLYLNTDGQPISAQQFMENLLGQLPALCNSQTELRQQWASPMTRQNLLQKLAEVGYGQDELAMMQSLINAEDSDMLDVIEYVQFTTPPMSRTKRVAQARSHIFDKQTAEHDAFLEFVLEKYIETGVNELAQEKLPPLLELKYGTIPDALRQLGNISTIRSTFINFQHHLYTTLS